MKYPQLTWEKEVDHNAEGLLFSHGGSGILETAMHAASAVADPRDFQVEPPS